MNNLVEKSLLGVDDLRNDGEIVASSFRRQFRVQAAVNRSVSPREIPIAADSSRIKRLQIRGNFFPASLTRNLAQHKVGNCLQVYIGRDRRKAGPPGTRASERAGTTVERLARGRLPWLSLLLLRPVRLVA